MLIGYIGYYLCRGNLSAALPLLSETFNYTNTQLGIVITASELAYALGKFINGPIADRVGAKLIFLIGMAGTIIFNLIFTQCSSIFMFTAVWCGARYFLSMGWGGLIKSIGAWYEPEKNGTIMGLISINFQFGSAIALLYCGLILSLGFSWQALFYIPAATLFLIMLWSAYAAKEGPEKVHPGVAFGPTASRRKAHTQFSDTDNSILSILKDLFSERLFVAMLAFSFFTTVVRSVFVFWTAKFLVDIGMGNAGAILKSSMFPILGVLGTVLLGWYTDKYARDGNRAKAMWIMLCGLVVCLFLIARLAPFGMEYANSIVILTGACGFFLYGPYSMTSGALTLDIAGSKGGGSATGMLDGCGYVGGALALWMAGYVSDHLGWSEVFYLLTGFSALAVISCMYLSTLFQAKAKQAKANLHTEAALAT
jgi:sugar phosphate permease